MIVREYCNAMRSRLEEEAGLCDCERGLKEDATCRIIDERETRLRQHPPLVGSTLTTEWLEL
jgi:hypothetical protein